jgi:hypothetical protein
MQVDNCVICAKCGNHILKKDAFHKSVIHLKYHPDDYIEKQFCGTQCIRDYVTKNTKPQQKLEHVHIYNWTGGQAGY